MANTLSNPCFIALAAVGAAAGLPWDQAGLLKNRQQDEANGQGDIIKRIVTGILLALSAVLAMYIYLTWRRGAALPRPWFVAPQPSPMAVPSHQQTFPQPGSMESATSSTSPAHSLPPTRVPVKEIKVKTKINAPAVGDHYMNK